MKRRAFLRAILDSAGAMTVGGSSAALLISEAVEAAEGPTDPAETPYRGEDFGALSILQGVTGPTQTQLNIVMPKSLRATYRLFDQDSHQEMAAPVYRSRLARADSDWAAENVGFDGLAPGRAYAFEVQDENARVQDRRLLTTLSPTDAARGFAVLSCANDSTAKNTRDAMWDSLVATRPAVVFMIGDNLYAAKGNSSVDPSQLWARYIEARQLKFKFYHQRELVPTVSVWDDHDFGVNNGDGSYPYKHEALEIFNAFYAQAEVPGLFARGPAASSWYRAFGVHFQIMDGRFFRREPDAQGRASAWGAEQEAWLERTLAATETPVFLMNGTLFFHLAAFQENYAGQFEHNFAAMLEKLSRFPHPLCFVSGDVHWTEISRVPEKYLGYRTYELVTSGVMMPRSWLAGLVMPLPNSWRLPGAGAYKNLFLHILPTETASRSLRFEVAAIGEKQKTQFRKRLHVTV